MNTTSSKEIKTFHNMLLRHSRSKDFENNTWKPYRCYLFRFLRWINKPLSKINVSDIISYEAYFKIRKEGCIKYTVSSRDSSALASWLA